MATESDELLDASKILSTWAAQAEGPTSNVAWDAASMFGGLANMNSRETLAYRWILAWARVINDIADKEKRL